MFKRFTVVLVIIIAIVSLCSCKSEPELSEKDEKVATVGLYALAETLGQYSENDSYKGVSFVISQDNSTGVFSFNNVSIPTNLTEIDSSWGTQTILLNGELVLKYEAPPASYPRTATINISFTFGGKTHTMEVIEKETGISSRKITYFKFDGTEYPASTIQ